MMIVAFDHQRNAYTQRKKNSLIMNYNQLRIGFCFISEVHFQLYENVFKKVQDKILLQKLLIQKNYPHEV
jgi:regulator of sigma D